MQHTRFTPLTAAAPDSIRLDALALRPPRQLDDGTRVYDAALVYANRPLGYPWGTEIPTVEALSAKSYLDGLKGISVVVHHPPAKRIDQGKAPKVGDGRRVGTVTEARWDSNEGEHGAVIVSLAVHEPRDQREVEALRSVSEGYRPELLAAGPGVTVQTMRIPNHIAITDTPRAGGAQIRVDEEPSMDPKEESRFDAETAMSMISKAEKRADMEKARADMAEEELKAMKAEKAQADAEQEGEEQKRTDAREAEIDKLANERAAELLKLQTRADALGVEIPDTAKTLIERTKAVATELKWDGTGDPATYVAGCEATRSDEQAHRALSPAEQFKRSTVRADARGGNKPTFTM